MRRKGTELYYQLVQELMTAEGLCQRTAEYELVIRAMQRHQRQGFTTFYIAKQLQRKWGMDIATYYRRLARARQTICIP